MSKILAAGAVTGFIVAVVACAASSNNSAYQGADGGGSGNTLGNDHRSADGGSNGETGAHTGNASSGGSEGGSASSGGSGSSSSGGARADAASGSSSGGLGSSSSSTSSSSSGQGSSSGNSSGSSSGGSDGGSTSSSGSTTGRKFVGNISTKGAIRSDFTMYWNQFTPENEGKWGSVQSSAGGSFNWGALDTEYQYCQSNNIIFKEHNFVWGGQQPSGNIGPTDVQNWMNAYCQRYPNVKLIDVVNEPLPNHNPAPYSSNIGGSGSSGWDWVVNALRWARAACPNAILLVNDYNTIEYQGDHDTFISMINAVKGAGAPIDAVGAQAHAAYNVSTTMVQNFIDDLATKTGLPVYITEYDINVADDNQQLAVMMSQFPMFWSDANVKGITLWGYIVGATWQPNTGLMTSTGTMRPAMSWLVNFLQTH